MKTRADSVREWRHRTKQKAVDSLGGKCCICDYDRCLGALGFHHLSDKETGIGRMMANPTKWQVIVKELRKCVCLCCRCHTELHQGQVQLPENITRFDESFAVEGPVYDKCPVCGSQKKIYRVTCSRSCAAKRSGRVDWDGVDLEVLMRRNSFSEIGRMLGISDAAVRKRAKKIGLLPVG